MSIQRVDRPQKPGLYFQQYTLPTQEQFHAMESQKANIAIRATLCAILIIGIFVVSCALSKTTPAEVLKRLKSLAHQQVTLKGGITIAVLSTLGIGSGLIIVKAATRGGKYFGNRYAKPIFITDGTITDGTVKIRLMQEGYIDTSTLNSQGTGKAFIYANKGTGAHNFISVCMLVTTPIHAAGAVVYNAVRAVAMPLFILLVWIRERLSACRMGEDSGYKFHKEGRKFRLADIPKQFALSVWGAVRAPFYGIALMMVTLYSFIDPVGGRKLGARIEWEWNNRVGRYKSDWLTLGFQKGFKWEGGGGPDSLGDHAFYIAGCWQPFYKVEVVRGTIRTVTKLHTNTPLFAYIRADMDSLPSLEPTAEEIQPAARENLVREILEKAKSLPVGKIKIYRSGNEILIGAHLTNPEGKALFISTIVTETATKRRMLSRDPARSAAVLNWLHARLTPDHQSGISPETCAIEVRD
ncbi:MAG: hypothetical protein ACKVOH_05680 [Chlamydiales bacterium]